MKCASFLRHLVCSSFIIILEFRIDSVISLSRIPLPRNYKGFNQGNTSPRSLRPVSLVDMYIRRSILYGASGAPWNIW